MSFGDLSRILSEQLQTPIVQNDSRLRLWCLIAKGYTDIEIDYRSAKRDWLEAQGIAFVTKTVEEAHSLVNRLAPEHLTVDAGADLRWVKNAGSIFIGHHTPQSMGDYISGPNHVLPTGRNGRIRGSPSSTASLSFGSSRSL